MENSSLNKYLADRGINVIWNTLGNTETLIDAYVADTQHLVDASETKSSHDIKYLCYSLFYDTVFRHKMTGFEAFDVQASKIKSELSPKTSITIAPCVLIDKQISGGDYKNKLKNSLKEIKGEILLYMSGGIDSEIVARALLDAGVKFTPIIFNWRDSVGNFKNTIDTDFAYVFCAMHNITPIVKNVDIETFWTSDEFNQLALDTQLISAHLITYVHMVDIISKEYPGATHLFGGEVRYRTNYLNDDKTFSNLVTLTKVTPGFAGNIYSRSEPGFTPNSGQIRLVLNSDGTWNVYFSGSLGGVSTGSPVTGTWWQASVGNPTIGSYEYRIDPVTVTPGSNYPSGIVPSVSQISWTAIGVGGVNAAEISIPNVATPEDSRAQFTVNIRSIANPATVISSTITFHVFNFV